MYFENILAMGHGASGDELNCNHLDFFYVDVVYSGREYDACDVTRSECIRV